MEEFFIMLYKSFALLAITVASISALPHEITKRDKFVHNKNGKLRLTCKLTCVLIGCIQNAYRKISLGSNNRARRHSD